MRAQRGLLVIGSAVVALVAGCGDDASSEGKADAGSAAGRGGAGAGRGGSGGRGGGGSGGSGGQPIIGPAISSAPPAWVRPDDCGGIGNLCPNLAGCGDRSTCQLEGNVCIPALEPGATSLPAKSAERPYCASFTCMTFEEASCFCTGEAGDANPSCSSPAALAGLCAGRGRSCGMMACCDELACVDNGNGAQVCEIGCTTGADCETGCCTDLRDTGDLICAEQEACDNPCKKRGEACTQGSSTMPNDCCRGACVDSENPDFAGCRARCMTNEDCPDTGCCTLFSNSTNGFCADAVYCTCGEAGAACGQQGQAICCEGTHCVGPSADMLVCKPECTDNADCSTNCCSAVTGVDFRVCNGPEYCGQ